ncbi:hypothetical protein LIER_30335 [Lithospermum erythrorhizon]|uniref:Reverse transcriptase Ty1/copia-type domain-containing protein n=1 Tax=Lithospermum erythrorhizon TaxID=34254 RepID=A0AAV3RT53_LITER
MHTLGLKPHDMDWYMEAGAISHMASDRGYPSNHQGYKCYDTDTRTIIVSRHIIFNETQFSFAMSKSTHPASYKFLEQLHSPLISAQSSHSTTSVVSYGCPHYPTITPYYPTTFPCYPACPPTSSLPPPTPLKNPPPPHPNTRSQHGIFKPNPKYLLHTSTTPSPIPKNPMHNNTWDSVHRSPNVNVIRSMWIFCHKFNSDCSFERHKAHLVGDDKTQKVGINCGDTFSHMVKLATIRTVLTLALSQSWSIHQLEVKNVFLHGALHEIVYMYQPVGFSGIRSTLIIFAA